MSWQCPLPDIVYNNEDSDSFWDSPFRWPFMKFDGLGAEDIFGHLYDRYNTAPMPILDCEAWHADVIDITRNADTIHEFYAQLHERKTRRLAEIKAAIEKTCGVEWSYSLMSDSKLGVTMQNLRYKPSMYDAAQAFDAMGNFVDDRIEKRFRREAKEREKIKSIWAAASETHDAGQIGNDLPDERGSTDKMTNNTKNQAVNGPTDQTTNQATGSIKKRKGDDMDNASNQAKKPRATTPQSSLQDKSPCARSWPDETNAISNDDKDTASGQASLNTENKPSTSFSIAQNASTSTDGCTKATCHQVPAPDNDADPAGPRSVTDSDTEEEEEKDMYATAFGVVPKRRYRERTGYTSRTGSTFYYIRGWSKINYESLGWWQGSEPLPAAVPSGGDKHNDEDATGRHSSSAI